MYSWMIYVFNLERLIMLLVEVKDFQTISSSQWLFFCIHSKNSVLNYGKIVGNHQLVFSSFDSSFLHPHIPLTAMLASTMFKFIPDNDGNQTQNCKDSNVIWRQPAVIPA